MTPPYVVAHYLDSTTFGGCEEVVYRLCEAADRTLWTPILIHHPESGLQRLLASLDHIGIPHISVPRVDSFFRLGALYRMTAAIQKIHPAIFHAHLNWPLACRFGMVAAWLARVPAVVATAHLFVPIPKSSSPALKVRLQQNVLDMYIAVSNEVRRHLLADMGVPPAKITVVRNGIPLQASELPSNANATVAFARDSTHPVILTVARLHAQKGHEFLIRAIPAIPKGIFVFAGDGPERRFLESLADRLGVAARIRFLGQRDDIASLLASCDLFVLPSLYEGLPVSVLEAMAAGKPVIATRAGGTDEAVVDRETGLLVTPESAEALATAIQSLLGDPSYAAKLGSAGRERVMKHFSAKSMTTGVAKVYDQLLKQRAQHDAPRST